MAKPNTYSNEKKDAPVGSRKRWWLEPAETVAMELSNYCRSLEDGQQRERYCGMIFEQMATGRAPISYGIAMDGRVKGDMATALFAPPSENYVAIAIDVFANKIGKNRPFLQWIPLAKDDTDIRAGCRQAEDYCDQIFEDLKTWPMVAQCFKDGSIHGNGPIFVDDDLTNNEVKLTRLQDDEILLDPSSGDSPPNFQIRLFMNRWEAIRRFTTGDKKDKEDEAKREALYNAPGCKQGFYSLDVGYDDIVALCIGFWIPGDKEVGRKVVAVGNVLLQDIPWKDDLPVARFVFEPIADSWKGQGCVEQQLPLQKEVDRIADNLSEQERRFCWAKWGVLRGEQIDQDQLIGNATVEANEHLPAPLDSPDPPEKLYEQLDKKGQQCLARVGISLNQSQGSPEPGIQAGVAIIAAAQIDDVRHVAVAGRLETFVEELGKLIIQAAGRCKPKVYSSGKLIEWPEIVNDQTKCKSRAFPMSGLPQSIPGRKQALSDMLQNGEIDKATYRRALGIMDIRKVEDVISINDDFVEYQLDKMLEIGEFLPPIVFIDFARALSLSQARLLREEMNEIPRKKLQLIAQYAAMCAQRVQELNPSGNSQTATPSPGAPPAPEQVSNAA